MWTRSPSSAYRIPLFVTSQSTKESRGEQASFVVDVGLWATGVCIITAGEVFAENVAIFQLNPPN